MDKVAKPKKFAIIDGKSVFYRGYYAMPNLSTKDGLSTGGIYGFAVMALEVIKKLKPDYVAVAWDKPKTNIRKRLAMYPEYKAGRKPAPADFYEQIPKLHELLKAFGWPLYELDDYEADDIMGTLALQAHSKGIETLLVTSDLDALQLVGPLTKVYALKTGLSHIELYSPDSFKAKYGLLAEQFLDLKALKGDSSDNIPGVPGIGEKTAIELLKQYKTLDNVYDNLTLLKESVRQKLENGKKQAYLSKKIGAIWTDAPVKLDLKEVDGSKLQPNKVLSLLQQLEFRNLIRQLPEIMQVAISNHEANSKNTSKLKFGSNHHIDSAAKLTGVKLPNSSELIVYSRSAAKGGQDPRLLILSAEPNTVYTFDLIKLKAKDLQVALSPILLNNQVGKIGFDIKSTIKTCLSLDISLQPVTHDVLVSAFILNPLRREKTLTELAQSDLNYEGSPLDELSEEEVIQRAPEIIGIIRSLYAKQKPELAKIPKFRELVEKVEWPVIPVLARMEHMGILLDVKYLKKFSVEINDAISDLEQNIYGYADQEFNINSPAQLGMILFDKLQLSQQGIKKGKTGISTAARELDKLRGLHPIIDLITQYREVTKLKNTYIDSLPKLVDQNNRLHTNFSLTIAQTGRLSSSDPNLQNIPVRTDLGKRIRTAFIAGKGNQLVSADYSQFELRISAAMSNDKELIEMFNRDVDIHTATAAQVYNRDPEDVTKQMRRSAKAVNFGILYGMSPHGLSVATGMTFEQARHFIEQYMSIRKPLVTYIEQLKAKANKEGYVETLLGRRRPTPDFHSSNFVVREAAIRAAVNMPFQGTAADIMKLAMIKVDQELTKQFPEAHILLQIHDSLLVESPEKLSKKVADLLKQTMEQTYKLPVKLTVDTTIGHNWGEL